MNDAHSATANAREIIWRQALRMKSQGLSNANIARTLEITPQRLGGILKRNRTHELKRGLGAASVLEKTRRRAKSKVKIPSSLFTTIFAPAQAIRNTCLEHGFRFNLNHICLQRALKEVTGLDIPIRTLRRYRFDSFRVHHLPDDGFNGTSEFPLSALSRRKIAEGVNIENIIGNSICLHHDLETAIVQDRRNALKDFLTKNGTCLLAGPNCAIMPFWYVREKNRQDNGMPFSHRNIFSKYLGIAENCKREILELIADPLSGICSQKDRKRSCHFAKIYLEKLSSNPYLRTHHIQDKIRGITWFILIFQDYAAGYDMGMEMRENPSTIKWIHEQFQRIFKRLATKTQSIPPCLRGLNPGEIYKKRKNLYEELLEHGWKISRHPGRTEDNQMHINNVIS